MSFISIVGSQNHLFSVPSGRKWREERDAGGSIITDTRRDLHLEISDMNFGNSAKWGGEMQGLQGFKKRGEYEKREKG